ncbi:MULTISPECIES: DDE-type integrase/transposase/recombinase [unclassified Mycolicibacterium]|uniref:DDE-type integrase/transposase/recombinase n=1 Tax=unclassified Mycolicibacterium TaxID=2636767 RepID=UPI00192E5211
MPPSSAGECWQSDFTHWPLADGTDTEILNWLDDHSRYLLYCTVFRSVSVTDVVTSFTTLIDTHGLPASTLTDNGSVYTSRFTHGHNDFERLIATLVCTVDGCRVGTRYSRVSTSCLIVLTGGQSRGRRTS